MFNLAIFKKTLRDSIVSIVLAAAAIMAFQVIFVWAMLNMGTDMLQFVSKVPFLTKIFEISFGIKVDGEVSLNTLFAVCFTHAIVLSLNWGVVIAIATRISVGEVERGTADLLLTLPVSRHEAYISASGIWWLSAALLAFCPIPGTWIALQIFETEEVVAISRFIAPAVNFFVLNLAVGGVTALIASCLDRRSIAVGSIVAVLLVSMVLNFAEPFIESLKYISNIGLMHYYRPVDVVRSGDWPLIHIAVLAATGVITWFASLVIFCRRDIPTA